MIGAVGQRHRDVDHRETAERPVAADSPSRRSRPTGMNWRGTTPPVIFSTNWKPEPRGSGLISSTTSPNWPWPPDCFLCRPRISVALADGLLVGDLPRLAVRPPRRTCACRRSSATRRCISPWPHSTIWCVSLVVLQRSEGSSSISLAERAGELHLVLAVLDADGDAVHRLRRLRRLDLRAAALVRRQRLAGLDLLQPAQRDRLAGLGRPALLRLLAEQAEGRRGALLGPSAPCRSVPSPNSPDSTRTIDSLPPCGGSSVLST